MQCTIELRDTRAGAVPARCAAHCIALGQMYYLQHRAPPMSHLDGLYYAKSLALGHSGTNLRELNVHDIAQLALRL